MTPSATTKYERIQALKRKRARAENMLAKARKKAIGNEHNPYLAVIKYIMFNDMLKTAVIFAVAAMVLGGIAGGFFTDYFADISPVLGAIGGLLLGAVIGFAMGTVGRVVLLVSVFVGGAGLFILIGIFFIHNIKGFIAKKQQKRIDALRNTIDKIDAQINKINGNT